MWQTQPERSAPTDGCPKISQGEQGNPAMCSNLPWLCVCALLPKMGLWVYLHYGFVAVAFCFCRHFFCHCIHIPQTTDVSPVQNPKYCPKSSGWVVRGWTGCFFYNLPALLLWLALWPCQVAGGGGAGLDGFSVFWRFLLPFWPCQVSPFYFDFSLLPADGSDFFHRKPRASAPSTSASPPFGASLVEMSGAKNGETPRCWRNIWVWVKIKPGYGPQILAHASSGQAILGTYF